MHPSPHRPSPGPLSHSAPPAAQRSRGRLIDGYCHTMRWVSIGAAIIAALALLIGVLAVCYMIFTRYVMGESTTWQTEFAIFSITAAMLLGSPYVLLTGGHVAVTVLPDALSSGPRYVMQLIAALVGLLFCAALAYGSWLYLLEAWHGGWTTGSVWNPPLWPALVPLALGTTLLVTQYLAEILQPDTPEPSASAPAPSTPGTTESGGHD